VQIRFRNHLQPLQENVIASVLKGIAILSTAFAMRTANAPQAKVQAAAEQGHKLVQQQQDSTKHYQELDAYVSRGLKKYNIHLFMLNNKAPAQLKMNEQEIRDLNFAADGALIEEWDNVLQSYFQRTNQAPIPPEKIRQRFQEIMPEEPNMIVRPNNFDRFS
jgi:hypothetical protein